MRDTQYTRATQTAGPRPEGGGRLAIGLAHAGGTRCRGGAPHPALSAAARAAAERRSARALVAGARRGALRAAHPAAGLTRRAAEHEGLGAGVGRALVGGGDGRGAAAREHRAREARAVVVQQVELGARLGVRHRRVLELGARAPRRRRALPAVGVRLRVDAPHQRAHLPGARDVGGDGAAPRVEIAPRIASTPPRSSPARSTAPSGTARAVRRRELEGARELGRGPCSTYAWYPRSCTCCATSSGMPACRSSDIGYTGRLQSHTFAALRSTAPARRRSRAAPAAGARSATAAAPSPGRVAQLGGLGSAGKGSISWCQSGPRGCCPTRAPRLAASRDHDASRVERARQRCSRSHTAALPRC